MSTNTEKQDISLQPATVAAGIAIGVPDWYYNETLPSEGKPGAASTLRTQLLVCQLGNCYFLLGMISLCVMSAIRRAVPYDAVAQEKLVGGLLTALAIADAAHYIIVDACWFIAAWDAVGPSL
ncbi:hypothetical protein FS837_004433 [Tulasnella sp. UAMH 9824]|nr:hypothetical protein FS837_004433 [Tulasnella sp. UAMH 9824]